MKRMATEEEQKVKDKAYHRLRYLQAKAKAEEIQKKITEGRYKNPALNLKDLYEKEDK